MKTPNNRISSDIIISDTVRNQPAVTNKPRPHIVAARAARQARRANH